MLVRKSIGEHVSVAANYYIDMVSSASIDVETGQPLRDERRQGSLSLDCSRQIHVQHRRREVDESDISPARVRRLSHDMFGDSPPFRSATNAARTTCRNVKSTA